MKIITVTMVKLTWYIFISISCILINVFIHVSIQLSIKNVDVLSSKLLFQICEMSQLSKQNMASRKENKWYFEGAVPMQKALIRHMCVMMMIPHTSRACCDVSVVYMLRLRTFGHIVQRYGAQTWLRWNMEVLK